MTILFYDQSEQLAKKLETHFESYIKQLPSIIGDDKNQPATLANIVQVTISIIGRMQQDRKIDEASKEDLALLTARLQEILKKQDKDLNSMETTHKHFKKSDEEHECIACKRHPVIERFDGHAQIPIAMLYTTPDSRPTLGDVCRVHPLTFFPRSLPGAPT